ncbi:MAG: GFA family protein [Salaquimonas sp.]
MPQKLPTLPWKGGCQCGRVRYTLNDYPKTFYCCHCIECQKQSSSMHGESVLVEASSLKLEGETKIWSRKTDSGNTTNCHFCPDCGNRIFHASTHRDNDNDGDIISLKGGLLEEIKDMEPVGHIWLKSAQAGFRADPEAMRYDAQPKSYKQLIEKFAKRYNS